MLKKIVINVRAILILYFDKIYNRSKLNTIQGVVFSMDRPLQLFSLLESYYFNCEDPVPLYVILKATDDGFLEAYKEVENYYLRFDIIFVYETSFKVNLIEVLNKVPSKYLFFLVDDNMFKSKFSFSDFLSFPNRDKHIFSLRLGKNLNFCYTRNLSQSLPNFKEQDGLLSWLWRKGECDWNYVFSVDGHFYETKEVLELSKLISFKAPNSFEANMNIFRYIFRRKKGLCYHNSVLINVCLNRVQDEIENISGDFSSIELLKFWKENKKIDIHNFQEIQNQSAHFEIAHLNLINRK